MPAFPAPDGETEKEKAPIQGLFLARELSQAIMQAGLPLFCL